MPVKNRYADLHSEITGWRHDSHRQPELLFEVQKTAGRVAELLRQFGCDEVVEGIGRTGVVGVINGRQTSSGAMANDTRNESTMAIRKHNHSGQLPSTTAGTTRVVITATGTAPSAASTRKLIGSKRASI